jgi:branched-chain amino acid transport system ATP-binding protein
VLLIEHNMRFVMGLCDTIYVVSSGKLVMSGTPAEVRSHPEVIEAYLGA